METFNNILDANVRRMFNNVLDTNVFFQNPIETSNNIVETNIPL